MPCMPGWLWVGANDDPGAYWICDCRPIPRSSSIPTPPEPGVGCHTYSGMRDGNRVARLWLTMLLPLSMIAND